MPSRPRRKARVRPAPTLHTSARLVGVSEADQPTLPVTGQAREPLDVGQLVGRTLADRFEVRRVVGHGRHGTVFEAHDLRLGHPVALKVLPAMGADALARFKQEFRALGDVGHDNLVGLYELFVRADVVFFTMELITGGDFSSWVRPAGVLDEARLRGAMIGLSRGLSALHAAGILHCDLKPSNVLVREDGRVAVVDFGLARPLARGADDEGTVGTPMYMSPEQAANLMLGPPSDWYSVGVMLYEALAGQGPFPGLEGVPLLLIKQVGPAPPVAARAPTASPELVALCDELLALRPERRPRAADVLRRLGAAPEVAAPGPATGAFGAEQFFGRQAELVRLDAALRRVSPWSDARCSVVAFVHGRSGTGKTALVRRFVQRVRLRGDGLVLEGRCHERESVPFKGIDGLVDVLRRHLHARARAGEPLEPPPGAAALARLFPVLGDVPGFQPEPGLDPEAERGDVRDPVALRDAAVEALRDVLRRLADEEPLVLVLDDLQWCDADSGHVLIELFQGSGRPQALLLGSYRDEADREGAVLAGLRARARPVAGSLQVEDVPIGPLGDDDTRALAVTLLSGREDAAALAELVAHEASGHPLLAVELARHVATLDPSQGVPGLRLEAVIRARVAQLSPPARRLLEVVVVAGQLLPQQVVLDACDEEARRPEVLVALRSHCFVRTQGVALEEPVEVYHDRIAVAVDQALAPDDRRAWHGRIAEALQRHHADDEVLAGHLEGSGRHDEAAGRYVRAADRAARALAFNRAASLFAAALRLVPREHYRRPGLQVALADALAHAGRGTEAGHAYLEAARMAGQEQVLELRRRAAEQLLRSGRIEEGLEQLRGVLGAAGLPEPPSPRRAMLGFLWGRLRIRARGLGFEERPSHRIPRELLFRVDTCWAAATGLVQVNVIVGQSYQAQHLLLALEAGEPRRVARALAMETLYAATAGEAGAEHTQWLEAQVEALAERLDDPRARGQAGLAAGAAAVYRGRFGQAYPRLVEAEEILRTRCSDVAWELSMVRTYTAMSLYYMGQLRAMASSMERSLKDAAARDDLHTALMLRVSYGPIEYLAADDVAGARAELSDCQARWPDQLARSTFLYVEVLSASRIERYAGDGAAAWQPFARHRAAIKRSLMLERPPLRIFMLHDEGCAAALAAHGTRGGERAGYVQQADRAVRGLEAEPGPWGAAMAAPIAASLLAAQGRRAEARLALERAIAAFEPLGMGLYAQVARRRIGELSADRGMIEQADAAMRTEGVRAPERMATMLVPPVLGWFEEGG